jgi:hypothetical protein
MEISTSRISNKSSSASPRKLSKSIVASPKLAKNNSYLLTPTTSTNTNGGAVTTPTDLFFERPETPEGEKLDLRQLSLALTRLLYPKV